MKKLSSILVRAMIISTISSKEDFIMKPKQRAIAALELREPDDIVPTFEFGFGLTKELLGRDFINLKELTGAERERAIKHNAILRVELAEELDWSIITEGNPEVIKELVQMGIDDSYLICVKNGDRTYRFYGEDDESSIMTHLYDKPDEFKRKLDRDANDTIESSKRLTDAGAECFVMGADYAGTKGPFLSPDMFSEFVKPYLHRIIGAHHQNGAYVIKHTDGDIMPIVDQILSCKPDALHSIDPTAGMEIAKMKNLVGNKVCLAGNVDCAAMVRHDREEICKSALYCLKHGMPGGGYIFASSNSIYSPMRLEDYLLMLEIRKEYGRYDKEEL